MFPSDDILIARGKYSTLGYERMELLKRIQTYCSLLINQASAIMRDVEKDVPEDDEAISTATHYLEKAGGTRAELVKICEARQELKGLAWGRDV